MEHNTNSDLDFISRHRDIWNARPELRSVYRQLFTQLTRAVGDRSPVIELGSGPGFFKEYFPNSVATDVISTSSVNVVCDGCAMPFEKLSVGAIVMLDVLHHMAHPLQFLSEAARVLVPGGVVAMIEPWITPASYLLYRYFHHEDCALGIDIADPFASGGKQAFDGNATIPYKLVQHCLQTPQAQLRLTSVKPFLALPYLATLGFKRKTPLPAELIGVAAAGEVLLGAVGRWNATRALITWERAPD